MRFWKILPALTITAALTIAACGQQAGEEAETELTPADTAFTTPPPADVPEDTMMMGPGDTMMMMGDTAAQM
ncbi:MAG: hypothetical protein ACREK3_05185 [Gemmatimonadota bacterium]